MKQGFIIFYTEISVILTPQNTPHPTHRRTRAATGDFNSWMNLGKIQQPIVNWPTESFTNFSPSRHHFGIQETRLLDALLPIAWRSGLISHDV
jgi:hypothetical protein